MVSLVNADPRTFVLRIDRLGDWRFEILDWDLSGVDCYGKKGGDESKLKLHRVIEVGRQ